jgi:beta-galactosidase
MCAWACGALVALGVARAGEGESRLSLDGVWAFSTNEQAAAWDTIQVPGNWDTLPRYSTHKGKGWYRRDFTVPQDWQGKRIRLRHPEREGTGYAQRRLHAVRV